MQTGNPFNSDCGGVPSVLTPEEADRLRVYFKNTPAATDAADVESVTSLPQFMEVIENTPGSVFYRGEDADYAGIMASALRPFKERHRIFKQDELLSEFYQATFAGLTPNERESFLAFARHHGIPTNLIDITSNPLIALYFACSGSPDEDGTVRFFDNYSIDITDLLKSEDIINSLSVYNKLRSDKELRDRFTARLYEFRRKHNINGLLEKCAEMIMLLDAVRGGEAARRFLDGLHDGYIKAESGSWDAVTLKTHKGWYKAAELFSGNTLARLRGKGARLSIIDKYLTFIRNDTERVYPALLGEVFGILADYAGADNDTPGYGFQEAFEVSFLPNILYSPLLSFGRAERQTGSFFVQAYYSANKVLFHESIRSIKSVRVKAEHKTRFLDALDRMDVNGRTIFKDYDHIAGYVTERYRKRRKL
jgi:hypothetical protein